MYARTPLSFSFISIIISNSKLRWAKLDPAPECSESKLEEVAVSWWVEGEVQAVHCLLRLATLC